MAETINPADWGAVQVGDQSKLQSPDAWGAVRAEQPGEKTARPVGTWTDYFRDLPGGIVSGLSSALSAAGQGASAEMAQPMPDLPTPQQVEENLQRNVTGELPNSGTRIGGLGRTTGEFLGNPASYVGPGGFMRRLITQAVIPAVTSETAGQIAHEVAPEYEGAARIVGGLAGPGIASAARKIVTPSTISAERQAAMRALDQAGVDYSAGQATGKESLRYKEAGSAAGQALAERQADQLTQAATRTFGENMPNAHDAVQAARPRIGRMLDRSAQRMSVQMDPQLGNDLVNISAGLVNEGLSNDQIRRILAQRDNIVAAFTGGSTGSTMSGTALHNLIRTGSPLERATKDADASVKFYANQLRNALFDAAERTARAPGAGPGRRQALEDFREARRQWANMRAIEDASSGAGAIAANGRLTPSAVRQAATARNKTDYARGRGDFNELARASNMLLSPLPNSGTAQRFGARVLPRMVGGALGTLIGGGTGSPIGAGLGGALGATVYPAAMDFLTMTRPRQAHLMNQLLPASSVQDRLIRELLVAGPSQGQVPLLPSPSNNRAQ